MMQVRQATVNDFPVIQSMRIKLFNQLASWLPDTFRSLPYPDGYLEAVVDDPDQDLLVVSDQDTLAGYALIQLKSADTIADPTLLPMCYTYLLDFYIDEKYRGQGLGRMLFTQVRQFALDNRSHCIELSVAAANLPAIGMYEHLGFSSTIQRMRYVLPDSEE